MKNRRTIFIYLSLVLAALLAANLLMGGGDSREEIPLNEFQTRLIEGGNIKTATVKDRDNKVVGELEDGTKYEVSFPAEFGDELTQQLIDADVEVDSDQQSQSIWIALLFNFLPILLIVGVFLFFLSSMQGGGRGIMKFGKAKAREVTKDQPQVSFSDVAGADEAVEELQEIKDFLEAPTRFQAMGAKIPKGVLLYGPPGTGKTLLARAVAGEAGVPFFTISGSDFVEMFVGVGASRVRDLFQQAKASAPAIIFIDEIDAVGRHRGAGLGGGHDEREQTLNQLLVEMDGFDVRTGVILIAATNRPDILDPALLRPGRFDRQIVVDMPDLVGRRQILEVHARNKPLADGINLEVVARRTPGFSGADIENLLNEAALLAARRGKALIGPSEIDEAIDRVMVGPERKSKVMSERERRITAFHEAGHALVGHVLPNTDPIHKVTIIPRGRAGGFTLALPLEEKSYRTRSELRDNLAMLLGGRTAEELIFGDPTTGAANDIEKATEIARNMVTAFGMSDRLGPQRFVKHEGDVFLGKEIGHSQEYSEEVAGIIDEEVARLIAEAHAEAEEILQLHRPVLDRLADALLEHETLNEGELHEIFSGIPAWEGSTVRPDVHPPLSVSAGAGAERSTVSSSAATSGSSSATSTASSSATASSVGPSGGGASTSSSAADDQPASGQPTNGDAASNGTPSSPASHPGPAPQGPPPQAGGAPVAGPPPTGDPQPLPHPSVPAGQSDPWKTPEGKPKRRWFNR